MKVRMNSNKKIESKETTQILMTGKTVTTKTYNLSTQKNLQKLNNRLPSRSQRRRNRRKSHKFGTTRKNLSRKMKS
jgi:hypothetical protein